MVSKSFRRCVRNVRVDKNAPSSAHVAIAFDVVCKLSQIQSWQLVSPSPLTPVALSQRSEEWFKRYRVAQSALPSNSPQEAAVARWSMRWATSSNYPSISLSGCCGLGALPPVRVRGGRVREMRPGGTARGQFPNFRLRTIHFKRVDESAPEGQGHLFWACVQGRLLEVKRCVERGKCNCGQFRKSVDFLKKCAGELPTIPISDQDSA